jgi:adenylate cyclase
MSHSFADRRARINGGYRRGAAYRAAMTGNELILETRRRTTRALVGANVVGGVVIFLFLTLVLPAPSGTPAGRAIALNLPTFVAYITATVALAVRWGRAWVERRLGWLASERPPDAREQRMALRIPLLQIAWPAAGWAGSAVIFGLLNVHFSAELGGRVATTLAMGGLATCGLSYLVGERAFRGIAARALATGPPLRPVAPGVVVRAVLAWALATGVPVVGIALVAFGMLNGDTPKNGSTAWSVIVLAVLALVVGAAAIVAAARSIADPLRSVRAGMARVERGDEDVDVPVDDASEVGLLQAGFNRMAAGLRERELLRDLFGRHVGEDVARRALEGGVELGGELREAAVLFVDVLGSTALASEAPPQEVVERLNEFFGVVLEAMEAHDGWVNKFEGDAALCVFGVPDREENAAGRALAAARMLAARLADGRPLPAAIGVSAGEVVAGNIGAAHRLEYTVIGDAVNEAARLTELAKQHDPHVLASGAAVERASPAEAERWSLGDEVVLRGRREPTRLAVPHLTKVAAPSS